MSHLRVAVLELGTKSKVQVSRSFHTKITQTRLQIMSDLYKPFLHQSMGVSWDDARTQLHNLILGRLHGNDLLLRCEGQLGDALEALLEMGLDP